MDFYIDYAPFLMPKVMRTSGRIKLRPEILHAVSFYLLMPVSYRV